MKWRVFLASYQHGDKPSEIMVGTRVVWPLVLSTEFPIGWPSSMLTTAPIRLEAFSETPSRGVQASLVAVSGGMRARWVGPGQTNLGTAAAGLLSVDYLTPPLVLSTGTVTELSVVSQILEADRSGRLTPGWSDWSIRQVEVVPAAFDGRWDVVGKTVETGVLALVDIED